MYRKHTGSGIHCMLIAQARLSAKQTDMISIGKKNTFWLSGYANCSLKALPSYFGHRLLFWPTTPTSAARKLHFCPKITQKKNKQKNPELKMFVSKHTHVYVVLMHFKIPVHITSLFFSFFFFSDRSCKMPSLSFIFCH